MKNIELTPTDNRKSFYGKAKIIIDDNNIQHLYSYNTLVAEYNPKTNKMVVNGYYSQTTARHINAFLVLNGFKLCNKQELLSYNN